MIKPINAMVEVNETKFIKDICKSLLKTPSQKAKDRNNNALQLLRKARHG